MAVHLSELPLSVRRKLANSGISEQKKSSSKSAHNKGYSRQPNHYRKPKKMVNSATSNTRTKKVVEQADVKFPEWLHKVLAEDAIVLVAAKIKKHTSSHQYALSQLINNPEKYVSNQEHYLQVSLFYRLLSEFPYVYKLAYSTPNGGIRDDTTAKKLKREGQKSGVPDMSIDVPVREYHGFKLEVKRGASDSSVSENQTHWNNALNFFKYKACIQFDYDACWAAIEGYVKLIYEAHPNFDEEVSRLFPE